MRRGGRAVFEHKKKSDEIEPADAKIIKKREGGISVTPPVGCSLCRSLGRSLARFDLDGRGGSRNRGGFAVEKQSTKV